MRIVYLFHTLGSRLYKNLAQELTGLIDQGHGVRCYAIEHDEPGPYESEEIVRYGLRDHTKFRKYGSCHGREHYTDDRIVQLGKDELKNSPLLEREQKQRIFEGSRSFGHSKTDSFRSLLDCLDLIQLIRDEQADLIYSMSGEVDRCFPLLAELIPQPIVSYTHGFSSKTLKSYWLERRLPKQCRHVGPRLAHRLGLDRPVRWWREHVGPIRVLFVACNSHGFACQYPVIQEMLKHSNFLVAITLADENHPLELLDKEQRQCYERLKITHGQVHAKHWHYVMCTDFGGPRIGGAIYVIQAHGMCFGNSDHRLRLCKQPHVNIVLGMSTHERKYLENEVPEIFSKSSRLFFPVGSAKLDALVQGRYSREDLLDQMGLCKDSKTILIASHWTPRSLLRTFGDRLLETIAKSGERCNIIQTAHNNLWQNPIGDTLDPTRPGSRFQSEQLWEALKDVEKRYPNVRVVRAVNVMPLLNVADILIGDYSSVLVEFSSLNRPILFFDNPKVSFSKERVIKLYREASFCFQSLDGLADLCQEGLSHPERRAEGRTRLSEYFNTCPGNSSKAIANLLATLGRVCSTESSRWRVAVDLDRRCQINHEEALLGAVS